jgi:hypothetical protein
MIVRIIATGTIVVLLALPAAAQTAAAGYVQVVTLAANGDYFVQVGASPTDRQSCTIWTAPEPQAVPDPALRAKVERVRAFLRERLLRGGDPSSRGSAMTHPPFVSLSGETRAGAAPITPIGRYGCQSANAAAANTLSEAAFARPPR